MARQIARLTATEIRKITELGYHADGAGLYLRVTGTKPVRGSWFFRYTFGKTTRRTGKKAGVTIGRPREMGLGVIDVVTLADARAAALEARKALAQGKDPIEQRRTARAAQSGITWGECVDAYIELNRPTWKNDAQPQQWKNSLRDHGPDRALRVTEITTEICAEKLLPIWASMNETATKVRARIERILDWAKAKGYRTGENPVRWAGHFVDLMPKLSKVAKQVKNHSAIAYADLPAFMAKLRSRKAHSARALEFAILTAARTSEVTGAQWSEITGDVWTLPANRMKAGKPHSVPLVAEAVAILEKLPKKAPPFALSENAMLYLIQKRMGESFTVHGFRSAFSDWVTEQTEFSSEVREMCLAHQIKDKAEAAYRRGNIMEKRRALMMAWAAFLN